MPYKGTADFRHDHPEKTGVLITNLGTPDAPTTSALRRYLGNSSGIPGWLKCRARSGG